MEKIRLCVRETSREIWGRTDKSGGELEKGNTGELAIGRGHHNPFPAVYSV